MILFNKLYIKAKETKYILMRHRHLPGDRIYIYIYLYMHMCMYLRVNACTYMYMYVYMCGGSAVSAE